MVSGTNPGEILDMGAESGINIRLFVIKMGRLNVLGKTGGLIGCKTGCLKKDPKTGKLKAN